MTKEDVLQELLYSTGVFETRKGYRSFILAVSLAADEPWRMENFCRDIYRTVAEITGQNVKTVEKALQGICCTIIANDGTQFLKDLGGGVYWNAVETYPRDVICIFACYLRRLQVKGLF